MEQVINYIRDVLRKDGITGMDSINHCIVFLINRMLNNNLCAKLDIDNKYAFSNILLDEHGDECGDQDLKARIYNKSANNFIHVIVNKLGFKNIKFKLESPQNLKLIYNKLKELDIKHLNIKYDIIGTIYELHLKSGSSNAMRDLGQYYTNRQVINYMIKLCDPKMNKDGVIEKIVDPTMGTGGFLTMAIKYLNQKYNNIDWKQNKNNIIGFDIDDNVKNMGLLNILLEIGELCNDTITKQDTLHNDMKFKDGKYDGKILEHADVILANEPMGLKQLKYDDFCDRIKKINIKGTKAEPAFLQLFMSALKDNGRCAVIIPDGVLFNESKQHQGTRKYLIENFNLKKVVALNDDFFLNTGVKTSILFFTKDKNKTNEISFCDIKLKNNEIEETIIITVPYDTIKNNKYSLFINKYNVIKTEINNTIEYKRLGDICILLPSTKHTSSLGNSTGLYRFYNSSQENKLYLDTYEINKDSIIIGNGGNLCIHYDKTFTPSKHVTVCQTIDTNVSLKYIYYYLTLNLSILQQLSAGSTIQWLNKTSINSIIIPIPALAMQEIIIKELNVLYSNIEKSKVIVDDYYKIIKLYIDCNLKNEKEYKKIGDVCEFDKIVKHDTSYGKETGKYKFHTGGIRTDLYCDIADTNELHIIQNRTNGSGKCNLFLDTNFSCATQTVIYRAINDENNIITKFIYYYFNADITVLENGYKGINHKNISKEYIKDIEIPLPSLEKQDKIVKYCDNLTDLINKIEQQMQDNKILIKQILESYLNQQ